ncbi:hypothetical protein PS726_05583 [Pseudomonas fluorescens]|nr:hypothetical protein PS726_05583 [Pseudomonas fluorescens]
MVAIARLAFDVAVLLVHLGSLGKTRLLFVHRLGDEDARVVLVEVQQQRRAVLHHRDELLVADPRRVEQDVVAQLADAVDHLPGVVDGAVIGAQLNDRQAERPRQLGLVRGDFGDQLAQVVFVETVGVDAADEAVGVARGFQIHRRGTGLQQRALVIGFVVVAVEQHQVAGGQQRVGHHLVRGRGAVEHEVGLVRIEHLRGVFLRQQCRAFVDQQVAELDVGVAHVGAKQRLAEEVEKLPTGRVLAKELAALVTGAGKGRVGRLGVVLERVEERRQQACFVGLGGGLQLVAVVFDVAGGQVEDAVHLQQHVIEVFVDFPGVGAGAGGRHQENRDIKPGALNGVEGSGQHIIDRHHGHGDVGEIGVTERDHLPGIQETGGCAFTGGDFQVFHRWCLLAGTQLSAAFLEINFRGSLPVPPDRKSCHHWL